MVFSSLLLVAFLIWITSTHVKTSSAYAKVRVRNRVETKNHLDR